MKTRVEGLLVDYRGACLRRDQRSQVGVVRLVSTPHRAYDMAWSESTMVVGHPLAITRQRPRHRKSTGE